MPPARPQVHRPQRQRTISIAVPGQSQREVILIGKPETAEPLTPVMREGETTVYMVQTPLGELDRPGPEHPDLPRQNDRPSRPAPPLS